VNKCLFYTIILLFGYNCTSLDGGIEVLDNKKIKIPIKKNVSVTLSYDPTNKNYVDYIVNDLPYLDDMNEEEIEETKQYGITFDQDENSITIKNAKYTDELIDKGYENNPLLSPSVLIFKEILKDQLKRQGENLPRFILVGKKHNENLWSAIIFITLFDLLLHKETRKLTQYHGRIIEDMRELYKDNAKNSRYSNYINWYIQDVTKTCREHMSKDLILWGKIYNFENNPAFKAIFEEPSSYGRLLFGGGLLLVVLAAFLHKKYGLQNIPSLARGLFKK